MSGLDLPQKLVSQLIEAVKTGILLADKDRTIRFTNEYLGALLEYPRDSLVGKPLQNLFFPEDVPVFLSNIMILTLSDKGFEGEVLLRKGDGNSLLVKLSTARYKEDSPERDILIFTLQDISRFKQMEKNLFYSERFAGLGKMTDQIAHQIRNPVASIGGFALRLAKEKVPYETVTQYTDIIYTEAIRLEQILDRLVKFAQISSPHFRPINLAEIFQEVLKALALIQETHRSRIKIPSLEIVPETTLYGDPGLLAQAVHCLLLNSLEASSDQDEIEVSGTIRDDQVIIEVKDRGEGVLAEHLPFVFDPFFSTKFNYLGLGLTTAKRIVTEHHGQVEIISIPKKGTEVSLVFPKDRRRPIRTRLIGGTPGPRTSRKDEISRFHIMGPLVVVLMSGTVAFESLILGEAASEKIGYGPNRAYQIQSGLANAATAVTERNLKPVNFLRPVMALLLISILLPHLIKALHQ